MPIIESYVNNTQPVSHNVLNLGFVFYYYTLLKLLLFPRATVFLLSFPALFSSEALMILQQ